MLRVIEIRQHYSKLFSACSPHPRHGETPLVSPPYRFSPSTKQPFTIRCLLAGLQRRSPPPLKPSHCALPPLHNSSFVSAGQPPAPRVRLRNTGPPFGRRSVTHSGSAGQGPIRGQSLKRSPDFRVFGLTFAAPPNAHSAERSWGRAQREREGRGEETDGLSPTRFVCEVPS